MCRTPAGVTELQTKMHSTKSTYIFNNNKLRNPHLFDQDLDSVNQRNRVYTPTILFGTSWKMFISPSQPKTLFLETSQTIEADNPFIGALLKPFTFKMNSVNTYLNQVATSLLLVWLSPGTEENCSSLNDGWWLAPVAPILKCPSKPTKPILWFKNQF